MRSTGTGLNLLSGLLYASKMLFLICLTSNSAAETFRSEMGGKQARAFLLRQSSPEAMLTSILKEDPAGKGSAQEWRFQMNFDAALMLSCLQWWRSVYSRMYHVLESPQYCSAISYLNVCIILLLAWLERWVSIKKKASILCRLISELFLNLAVWSMSQGRNNLLSKKLS